ncbi:MAG: hypothetical protein KDA92_13830, partial [Planctomycetales bacterium]|nr:hypothetical protein [Planctomycetales bacterium]
MSVTPETVDVISPAAEGAEPTQAIDVRLLGKQMDQLLRGSVDSLEATRRFVTFTRKLAAALAVLHYANDSTGQLAADPICHDPDSLADATLNQLYALAVRAQQQQTVQLAQGNGDDPRLAMALPVFCRDGQVEVLVVVVSSGKQELAALAVQVQMLQFV